MNEMALGAEKEKVEHARVIIVSIKTYTSAVFAQINPVPHPRLHAIQNRFI